jgi:L-threonine-O-3-phosphate decarboxylase
MDPDAVAAAERVPHGGTTNTDLLEFSANVNPEIPEGVEAVYESALPAAQRYPDDGYREFREAAARNVGCDPGQVVPTGGGLEAIRLAIGTHLAPGERALVPAPSFGEYAREVRLQGGEPVFVPGATILDADTSDAALAIVCNPNNPTGRGYERAALEAFARRCRESDTTLLVDEAFLSFTERPSLAGREGIVVARSLTKLYGLPGLRAGYAVATGESLDRLSTARRAWSMSTPAAAVGTYCLGCEAFAERTRERVGSERERMRERLSDEFEVHRSDAPFLLLDVGDRSVDGLIDHCRESGIAIRDARTFRGLDSHVRVAVRTPAENDRLLSVMCDA